MIEKPILNGLILHGGKSSRMGFDKGLITFHDKPQREFLFGLLTTFCSDVYISTKLLSENNPGLNFLADKYDIDSPLNGILTAFDFKSHVAWLTVPVDMPGINEDHLRLLISRRDTNSLATCFLDSEGKLPEPLVTIWEPAAFSYLKDFHSTGNQSPREFLIRNKINIIPAISPAFYSNINTPDQLKEYKKEM